VSEVIKKIDFHVEHINMLSPRDYELRTVFNEESFVNRLGMLQGIRESPDFFGDSWTFIVDGRILSCLGFLEIYKGVAEIWQIPSIFLERHVFAFSKAIKQLIENVAKEFKYQRFQTTSPDDDLHERWMKFLGFEKEGVLRRYVNGEDFIQYARLF